MTRLVFAYGSNLDERQMARRCPGATVVFPAALPDHRLAFAGHSAARGGGVATVVPSRGSAVPGLVWEVDDLALRRLDAFEGAPIAYRRDKALVRPLAAGWGGDWLAVELYAQPPGAAPAKPSLPYLGQIALAYNRLGFPPNVLRRAVAP